MPTNNSEILEQRKTLLASHRVLDMIIPNWESDVKSRASEIGILRINKLMDPILNRGNILREAVAGNSVVEQSLDTKIIDVLGQGQKELDEGFCAYGTGLFLHEWADRGADSLVDAVESSANFYKSLVDSTGGEVGSVEVDAVKLIASISQVIRVDNGKRNMTLGEGAEISWKNSNYVNNPEVGRNLKLFIESIQDLQQEWQQSSNGKEGNSSIGSESKE